MNADKRGYFWLALVGLTGCAYVGDPLYPALNIPTRVGDVTMFQRGSNLEVYFTEPVLTTEGLVLKQIGGIELRVGPNKSEPFNTQQWAATATKVNVPVPEKAGPIHASVPLQAFVGQAVVVGVRVINSKGRASDWSNLKVIVVQPPLATPAGVEAMAVAEGVLVKWNAAGTPGFRVYRKAEKELLAVKVADVTEQQYLDPATQYGTRYEYWVQGFQGGVESELGGPAPVQPEDKFAPAVPVGLAVSAGVQTIDLAWERNTEPDFKGYRVYRAVGDGPFEKIAELIEAPSFGDSKIEAGKRYRYAVSSVDQTGNESEKTAPVEMVAP